MPEENSLHLQPRHRTHTRLFFVLSILALLILLILSGMLYLFFFYEPVATTVSTPKTVVVPSQDPLISGVPNSESQLDGVKPAVLPSDPKRGAINPKVTLIEFGDYECPDCAETAGIIDALLQEFPNDLQVVWKDFPLTAQHAQAQNAAIAARCAAEQGKFWEYNKALFGLQAQFVRQPWNEIAVGLNLDKDAFSSCNTAAQTEQLVVQSFFVGKALNIEEVPTFFVNKHRLEGLQTREQLRSVIQTEIDAAQ